jgi:hypothetical protein
LIIVFDALSQVPGTHHTGGYLFLTNYGMHFRGWLGYTFALMLIFIAVFMVLTRFCGQGNPVDNVKVIAPPTLNTMEQLLAVQNAISQSEGYIQDANIVLLKIRALLLCIFPQVLFSSFCLDWPLHLPLFSLLLL